MTTKTVEHDDRWETLYMDVTDEAAAEYIVAHRMLDDLSAEKLAAILRGEGSQGETLLNRAAAGIADEMRRKEQEAKAK